MALKITPQEAVDKHARRLVGSTEDIRRGIERTTVAPGQAAAGAADRMLQNLTTAVTSGRWARNVSAVSLPEWKRAAIDKGIPRIAAGVEAAKAKNVQIMTRLFANIEIAQAAANAIPKGGIEQSIARMTAYTRAMHDSRSKG